MGVPDDRDCVSALPTGAALELVAGSHCVLAPAMRVMAVEGRGGDAGVPAPVVISTDPPPVFATRTPAAGVVGVLTPGGPIMIDAPVPVRLRLGPPRGGPRELRVELLGGLSADLLRPIAALLGAELRVVAEGPAPDQIAGVGDLAKLARDDGVVVLALVGAIRGPDGGPALGLAATVGAVELAVAAVTVADRDVVAHELLHVLGLHHTVERSGAPGVGGVGPRGGCGPECDVDADGAVPEEECEPPAPCSHEQNLMFWGVTPGGQWVLREDQLDLAAGHPVLTRAAERE